MGKLGENHLAAQESSSEEDSDEYEDSGSDEEEESEEESYDEEEESEEEESEDEEFEDEDGEEDPLSPGGDVVEDYGLDYVPGDEEMEKDEDESRFSSIMNDPQKKRSFAVILCCCILICIILGVVLGIVLGGNDDSSSGVTATRAPTTDRPTASPSMVPTETTPAPTVSLKREYLLEPDADTYIFLGETSEERDENVLLVQNDVSQTPVISLLTFDITDLPDPRRIIDIDALAFLTLSIEEVDSTEAVTIGTTRFVSLPANIDDFPLEFFNFDSLGVVSGPTFDISPGDSGISIDISELLFEQPPYVRRRELSTQRTQLFIGLTIIGSNETDPTAAGVSFSSSEGPNSPRLEIELDLPSSNPSVSPAPSTSVQPTIPATLSIAPSLPPSSMPTSLPTLSDAPTASAAPSQAPVEPTPNLDFFCNICDGDLSNPNGPIQLPQIGQTTCQGLQSLGDWGQLSAEECTLFKPQVNTICCEEVYICPICSDESTITKPDAIVQGSNTCIDLFNRAAVGLIQEVDCPALQDTTDDVCCGPEV